MAPKKTLRKILQGSKNVRFGEFTKFVEAYGFRLVRVSGSHHIYGRHDVQELVNIQQVGGEAKWYQIKQFMKILEKYNLEMNES